MEPRANHDRCARADVRVLHARRRPVVDADALSRLDRLVEEACRELNHHRLASDALQIDLQSVGSEAMMIELSTRRFNKTVEPGKSVSVDYWATARVQDANIGASAPIVIRTRLHLWKGDSQRLESFTRRVNGHFAVGVS